MYVHVHSVDHDALDTISVKVVPRISEKGQNVWSLWPQELVKRAKMYGHSDPKN